MKKYILWDLDGTLTDPKEGILRCILYALEKLGLQSPPLESLTWCIGPPLHDSFHQLAPNSQPEDIVKLIAFYRERFTHLGLYENKLYPFIVDILSDLKQTKKHYLATSKPHLFANRILNHFELSHYFDGVFGSEMNGDRSDKADLIEHILKKEKISTDDVYMIGDRKFDILGAKKNNIKSIGIAWGYGSAVELHSAGADHIFESPQHLKDFLLKN